MKNKVETPVQMLIEELTKDIPNKINNKHLIIDNTINGRNLKELFNEMLNKEVDFIHKMVNKFTDIEIPKDAIIEELKTNNYGKQERMD